MISFIATAFDAIKKLSGLARENHVDTVHAQVAPSFLSFLVIAGRVWLN